MEHRIGKATFNGRVRSFVLGNPLKCELEACAGGYALRIACARP